MQAWEWAVNTMGVLLALLVLVDVFLTVLHMSHDGPIAHALTRGVWHGSGSLGRRFPAWKSTLSPLAGPLGVRVRTARFLGGALLQRKRVDRARIRRQYASRSGAPGPYLDGYRTLS